MARDWPLFLERASFRRRRLGDAARLLPVFALIAVLLPVWWLPGQLSFGAGAVWLFGGWALLIAAIAMLHRALHRADRAARLAGAAVAEAEAIARAAEASDGAADDL